MSRLRLVRGKSLGMLGGGLVGCTRAKLREGILVGRIGGDQVEEERARGNGKMVDVAESGLKHEWGLPLKSIRERFVMLDKTVTATPETLKTLFGDLPAASQLPKLGRQSKSGSLVAFTCFVQDVFEQEMYYFRYGAAKNKTAICTDELEDPELENQPLDAQLLSERLPLYCTTVPASLEWGTESIQTAECLGAKTAKRKLEDQMDSSTDMEVSPDVNFSTENAEKRNRQPANSAPQEPQDGATSLGLNLSIASDAAKGGFGTIVKVYDKTLFNQALLNQVVEVVGIVENGMGINNGFFEENPGSDLDMNVYRIHALSIRKLSPLRYNPSTECLRSDEDIRLAKQELKHALSTVRPMLCDFLRQSLGGDELAAQYLLLVLTSAVEKRAETLIMGKVSLNIRLPAHVTSERVITAVKCLSPRVVVIPMTIELLNSENLIPKKNYSKNRLQASRLQLAEATVIILDETELAPGQLNERGVKNLSALRDIATRQALQYDFEFYNMEMNVDYTVICLSRTASLVPCDTAILCAPSESFAPEFVIPTPSPDWLHKARMALALLQDPDWTYDVPEAMSNIIEKEFVARRRRAPKNTTQEHLHSWLTLCKLVSRVTGESELTESCWQSVLKMDDERLGRMESC